MKLEKLRCKPASIPKARWASYAAAGAATALIGSNCAEAAIHYSGLLNVHFPTHRDRLKTFQLGDPDRVLGFYHGYENGIGAAKLSFSCQNLPVSVQGGTYASEIGYVQKLSFGQNISSGFFGLFCPDVAYQPNFLASGDRLGSWRDPGIGYIGFRVNNFGVFQYGWFRVRMGGAPLNGFSLLDYAYADPGEPIFAGQRSSAEQPPDQGSLGWLALGGAGLVAWRKSRSRKPHSRARLRHG